MFGFALSRAWAIRTFGLNKRIHMYDALVEPLSLCHVSDSQHLLFLDQRSNRLRRSINVVLPSPTPSFSKAEKTSSATSTCLSVSVTPLR